MSRAFVKEDAGDSGDTLPDRPISPHANYVTPEGLALIDAELVRLQGELAASGDDRIAAGRAARSPLLARPACYRRRGSCAVRRLRGPLRRDRHHPARRRTQTFRIVGEDEADPAHGSLAYVAPLARALMGKRFGEAAEVAGSEAEIVQIA